MMQVVVSNGNQNGEQPPVDHSAAAAPDKREIEPWRLRG